MSLEGSLIRPESAEEPSEMDDSDTEIEDESGTETEDESGTETESIVIPEWNLNARTYYHVSDGHFTYDAEEQSCVWPPMLLVVTAASVAVDQINMALAEVRNMLAKEGIQAEDVTHTKCVCREGDLSHDMFLFVLPPRGLSFVAAKVVDHFHSFDHNDRTYTCYYPSLKDMKDIKMGRVPESCSRYRNYHEKAREAWHGLKVDLLRDDGICVGEGVCQKCEERDIADGEVLGDLHVGVLVLAVVDDLIPSEWVGSLRRWKTTHAIHNGVPLSERWRQQVKGKSSQVCCENEPGPSNTKQAQEVLKDQAISSVAPCVSSREDDDDDGFDCLSEACSKACQDAIHDIEKSSSKSDSGGPKQMLHDGSSFKKKLKMDEKSRMKEIEDCIAKASSRRSLMEHLGRANGSRMARGVVRRLKDLHKLNEPGSSSTLISSMFKRAEEMELNSLRSITEEVEREKQRNSIMGGFESERERLILKRREEQHQELLKLLASTEASQLLYVEEFVTDRFKFVNSVDSAKKESESVVEWLAQYTARATDEVKKAHMVEKKNWEEQMAKAEAELLVARRELDEQNRAIPKCAICYESLEGAIIKSGNKRSRDNVVHRQRACFSPCMHTNMCLKCSVESWKKYKRCPMCNTACPNKPQPIYM